LNNGYAPFPPGLKLQVYERPLSTWHETLGEPNESGAPLH